MMVSATLLCIWNSRLRILKFLEQAMFFPTSVTLNTNGNLPQLSENLSPFHLFNEASLTFLYHGLSYDLLLSVHS